MTDEATAEHRTEPSRRGHADVRLLTTRVGHRLLGFDPLDVRAVDDIEALEKKAKQRPQDAVVLVDVARLLGVEVLEGYWPRRVLLASTEVSTPTRNELPGLGTGRYGLIVGDSLKLRTVSYDAIFEFPPLLGGLTKAAGYDALFVMNESIGFLLDLRTIAKHAARGSSK